MNVIVKINQEHHTFYTKSITKINKYISHSLNDDVISYIKDFIGYTKEDKELVTNKSLLEMSSYMKSLNCHELKMTFGKYKGLPYCAVFDNLDYTNWLLSKGILKDGVKKLGETIIEYNSLSRVRYFRSYQII